MGIKKYNNKRDICDEGEFEYVSFKLDHYCGWI
jgi:hypothetical protein